MSLTEIEKQVRELPAADRTRFVSWILAHEHELIETPAEEISSEVMDELLRRRQELRQGDVRTFSIEESTTRVREALDEVYRSRH